MSQGSSEGLQEAKEKLKQLRGKIKSSHPANDEIPKYIKEVTPSKDSKEIKHFSRIKKKIKAEFESCQDDHELELEEEGRLEGAGTQIGQAWDQDLKKAIDNPSSDNNEAAKAVITALKSAKDTVVPGIEFLQTQFPLYGFMGDKKFSKTYFWHGYVDAIGWFEEKFVIVDWKVVDLLNFWKKDKDAYGYYLHQCLIYSRLLQLHLELEELPCILIVPISNVTRKNIHPALFRTFPEKCTYHLALYEWYQEKRKKEITVNKDIINEMYHDKQSLNELEVKDLFKDGTKVSQLLDALGLKSYTLKSKN